MTRLLTVIVIDSVFLTQKRPKRPVFFSPDSVTLKQI
jgi:hypothetical protein